MKVFLRYILLPLVTLLFGFSIGLIIRDWPKFTMDYNLKITDVLTVIVTFGIGVFIPLLVKRIIEDRRSRNEHLLEELRGFNVMAENIHNYIQELYSNKKILPKDKDYLNIQLDLIGKDFNELFVFLSENCSRQTVSLLEGLKTSYFEYWKISTSIEVIGSTVDKIDDQTYKKICGQYTEMNKHLRKIKIAIIKH